MSEELDQELIASGQTWPGDDDMLDNLLTVAALDDAADLDNEEWAEIFTPEDLEC